MNILRCKNQSNTGVSLVYLLFLLVPFFSILFIALFSQVPVVHGATLVNACSSLSSANTQYILSQDIGNNGGCISIQADNISFDGNGSKIIMSAATIPAQYGITLAAGANNARVFNVTLIGAENITTLDVESVINTTISNVSITNSGLNSIALLANRTTNLVANNIIFDNQTSYGFYLDTAVNNTISHSTFNRSAIPYYVLRTTVSTIYNTTFDVADQQNWSTIYVIGSTNITLANISRTTQNVLINVTATSQNITISNFSVSLIAASHNTTNLQVYAGAVNQQLQYALGQTSLPAIWLLNTSGVSFENISILNALSPIIKLDSDGLTNTTLSSLVFTNISYTNTAAFLINKTSYTTDVRIILRKMTSGDNLFDVVGNLFVTTFEQAFGSINFTLPINGTGVNTGNFSQAIGIGNQSIRINSTQTSSFNQPVTLSYFNMLTNFSSQKLLKNGVVCLSPSCNITSALNSVTMLASVSGPGNYTFIDVGSQPPGIVTNLVATDIQNNNITWNWTNPSDLDFNQTLIYINGIYNATLNNSQSSFILSGPWVMNDTLYSIIIKTVDLDGNINETYVQLSTRTLRDSIPAQSVANLSLISLSRDFLLFNWSLPTDIDYIGNKLILDGTPYVNITNQTAIRFSGLMPNTSYNFSVESYDRNGNKNITSLSATTLDDVITITNITDCGSISAPGEYMLAAQTLSSNYTCLFINSSNVYLDGNGSTLYFGSSNETVISSGIRVGALTGFVYNVTIVNLTIIGNSLFNITRYGILTNETVNSTLAYLNISFATTGISLMNASNMSLFDNTIVNTQLGIETTVASRRVSISNSTVTNTSTAFLLTSTQLTTITNVTALNVTSIVFNVSSTSSASVDQFNWSLTSNTATGFFIEASNTTTLTNSSISYGTLSFTNFSSDNFSGYQVGVTNGYFIINKTGVAAIAFQISSPTIDSLNVANIVYLGQNNIVANSMLYPYLNTQAYLTFYNMSEGAPVYVLRNTIPVNTLTTPTATAVTVLTSATPQVLVSNLDGNYSLLGYTLQLLTPVDKQIIETPDAYFNFTITPTYNRTLTNCKLELYDGITTTKIREWHQSEFNGVQKLFSYHYSNLVDATQYQWTTTCTDNLSVQVAKSINFTVTIPPAVIYKINSGSFGAYPGAIIPWVGLYYKDKTELNQSLFMSFRTNEGVRIKVNNNSHFVGILATTATTATINVSSKPQQATLSVKETKQFILDENETMGISVTLEGVTPGHANLTIVPVVVYQKPISNNDATNLTQSNATTTLNANGQQDGQTGSGGGYKATAAGSVSGKFVTTQGIIVIVIISGVVLFCGAMYYFFLILKYRRGNATKKGLLSPKKGIIAEFLFPFMPGGEFWSKKKKEKVDAQTAALIVKNLGPKPEDVARYQKTITQLVPQSHVDHIESRLRVGNQLPYVEFELISNGYTHEQAKSLIRQYQVDQFVKHCVYMGATNEQIQTKLRASGWSQAIIDKIFETKKKEIEATQSVVEPAPFSTSN